MKLKNRALLFFVRIFHRYIQKNEPKNRFLVISATGLGDSLWATPALESLRRSFPNGHIVLLTTPLGEQALRNNPWVDKTIVFQEPLFPKMGSLWKQLRKEKIDTILNFHSSQRQMLPLASLIGATRIVGTAEINKGLDSLLTTPLKNRHRHEIVRRLELVEAIGAKRCSEKLSFFLTPTELSSAPKLTGRWIALHPGSKDGFKRWPPEHFGAVGKKLQQMGYQILITGSPEELDLMNRVAAQIPNAKVSDPKLSLRCFGALLQQLSLLISNDTGPVHLALALNIPTIALYSPTDPTLCGPHYASNGIPISKRPSCNPCLKRQCRRPFCLLQIGPEDVVNTALDVLYGIKNSL